MADENKIRDAADAVKGIAEAIPVYQDVVQPAAKEIGTALQTVAKSVHVALAPISALVWGYEKIKDYLQETLTEKLKNVPPERIVPPSPTLAGPALESLRFAGHDPTLRELYANLLATSMDSEIATNAHPAFVDFLRQMTPDEARIVQLFSSRQSFPVISMILYDKADPGGTRFPLFVHFSLLGYEAECAHPELTPNYLDNLVRLGLAEINTIYDYESEEPGFYKPLLEHPEFDRLSGPHTSILFSDKEEDKTKRFEIKKEVLRVTTLGRQFCAACITPQVSPDKSS